jgi:sulfur carrier protein ThiS
MTVIARPHSFSAPQPVYVPPGSTLADIVKHVVGDTGEAIVMLEGEFIPKEKWRFIRPKDHANVVLTVPLHGGDNWINTVLSIIVVIVAGYFLGPQGSYALFGSALGNTLTAAFVATAGVALVNALFPIRMPEMTGTDRSPTYSIGGARNDARPFQPVPVILGTHQHTPPLAARSYTEIFGDDEYLRMMVAWGYGPLEISNIRIGSTPLSAYSIPAEDIQTRQGFPGDAPITVFPSVVLQTPVGIELVRDANWLVRTSETDGQEVILDFLWPAGLQRITKTKGKRTELDAVIDIEWGPTGTVTFPNKFSLKVSGNTVNAIRRSYRIFPSRQQIDVRCKMRLINYGWDEIDQRSDRCFWGSIKTLRRVRPINFRKPLAVTAIRIKATDQLSGIIDNLNATVRSIVPVWNGSNWNTTAASSNPAALFRHVLTGPANARPRTAASLDDAALGAWFTFCQQQGYTYNRVHDFQQSVWDTLADIASAGRAAPTIKDGKWSVVVDTPNKPVVQHFTPRNSWGFRSSKVIPIQPHAWRARFINADKEYQADERIVVDDGYTEATATNFETIEFPGITSSDLAWKLGRYHIAQARLRPEEYSFFADFEHLACQRGDVIRVSHDVTLWGEGWGRVKSVQTDGNGDVVGIVTDEKLPVLQGQSYNMRFRLSTGDSLLVPVTAPEGENTEFACSPVAGIQAGDLFMFGRTGRESVRLIVKRIERAQDMVARLVCVDEAPAIYDADTGTIPPFDSVVTDPVDVTRFPPAVPGIVVEGVQSGTAALLRTSNGFLPRILVPIQPGDTRVPVREWQVRFRETGSSWTTITSPVEQTTIALLPVETGETYEIQARAVSQFGVASAWSPVVTETVLGEDEPPSDVTGFSVNIVGFEAHLSWNPVLDIDLSHYRIMWSPEKQGVTWDTATDVVLRASGSSATVPAQVGTYLIKAVDIAGNESVNAAVVITSIAKLTGLNIVEILEEPDSNGDWNGGFSGATYDESVNGVRLEGSAGDLSEFGRYFAADLIDLQGVFTSRVTGNLRVSGQDLSLDLYSLGNLYDAGNLYGAPEGSFRAGIELSTTDDDPDGDPEWSEWKRLVVGDYSARAYRFRVWLEGDGVSITPVMTEAQFEVDMPDRLYRFSANVPAEVEGIRVPFEPPFFAFPASKEGLGLSVLNGEEGDKYTIDNLDETGFDIAFTNGGNPVPRTISGIAQSYGEKIE